MSRSFYFPPFMGQRLVQLAPGVQGITRRDPKGVLVIVLVVAELEGAGDVGRYLDSLPLTEPVIVEACTSPRLAGMLERRGFVWKPVVTFEPLTEETVDGYVRGALSRVTHKEEGK